MGQKKITTLLDTYAALRTAIDDARALWQAQEDEILAAIPAELRTALERVQADRARRLPELEAHLAQVTDQVKGLVGATGETVKHAGWQAIYSRGRVAWNDGFLQGYAATHPEILQARSEGQPSVSLRPVKPADGGGK